MQGWAAVPKRLATQSANRQSVSSARSPATFLIAVLPRDRRRRFREPRSETVDNVQPMAQVVDRVVARQRSCRTVITQPELKAIAAIAPGDIVMYQVEPRCGTRPRNPPRRCSLAIFPAMSPTVPVLNPSPFCSARFPMRRPSSDSSGTRGSVAERDVSDERDIRLNGLKADLVVLRDVVDERVAPVSCISNPNAIVHRGVAHDQVATAAISPSASPRCRSRRGSFPSPGCRWR